MAQIKKRLRQQKRIPGLQRSFKLAGVLPSVERLLMADANRWGVTTSFVQAFIVTEHYRQLYKRKDFELQEDPKKGR